MTVAPPLQYRWMPTDAGEAWVPLRPRVAGQHFAIGEVRTLDALEERSMPAHRHYFAVVREAWKNLPDRLAEQYPDDETLRKHALIRTGWCTSQQVVCATKAEALRWSAFVAPIDPHTITVVRDSVVTRYTARTQSLKGMGAEDFTRSKEDVLAWLSDLLGTPVDALKASSGASA